MPPGSDIKSVALGSQGETPFKGHKDEQREEVTLQVGIAGQEFVRGLPQGPLERVADSDDHGTTITFWPDDQIFEATDYTIDTIQRRLRDTAFLTAGLEIVHDLYPYTASSTGSSILFPQWALAGGRDDFAARVAEDIHGLLPNHKVTRWVGSPEAA